MRFAILDILKEKQDITAEDLVRLGMFTEETRYHSYLFGLIREDVANQAAGSAIRMGGATIAKPGYTSVPSDFLPFNLGSSGFSSYARGQGYSSFNAFKAAQGNAGLGMEWHHIVEQSQTHKSGFMPEDIHSTENIISIDAATHRKISAYYSSIQPFT